MELGNSSRELPTSAAARVNNWISTSIFLVGLVSATVSIGAERVSNFVLLDQQGISRELYYGDARAVVLTAYRKDSPAATAVISTALDVNRKFAAQDIKTFLVDSYPADTRAALTRSIRPTNLRRNALRRNRLSLLELAGRVG